MRTTAVVVVGFVALCGSAFAQSTNSCPADPAADIAAACPCDADGNGQTWTNHGKYVSSIVRHRNTRRQQGCLDAQTQKLIARCAARSTCGKDGAVLCCIYDTSGTCGANGTCSNDATIACLTSTDCITSTG